MGLDGRHGYGTSWEVWVWDKLGGMGMGKAGRYGYGTRWKKWKLDENNWNAITLTAISWASLG